VIEDKSKTLLLDLLLEKFDTKQLKGLLTGKLIIDKPPPLPPPAYVRRLKNETNVVCGCNDELHKWCVPPDTLLTALDDAANEMNYSNWHTDKFNRAQEIIIRYCEQNNISLDVQTLLEG
jgi:hypothetical protein